MNTVHNKNTKKSNLGLTHDIHATALLASLFYMMTSYSHNKDKSLIKPILENLEWLSVHPEVVNSQLQEIFTKLKANWETMSESDLSNLSNSIH